MSVDGKCGGHVVMQTLRGYRDVRRTRQRLQSVATALVGSEVHKQVGPL